MEKTSGRGELDPSFDEFVASGSARLLRSAYLLTGDRDHSEDLLQTTLVRTARRWDVARDSPHAYAHRVLVNLLHDRRRSIGRRVTEQRLDEFEDRRRPVMDGAQALVDRMAIISAVRGLPARQREVVVLRFFADLSVSETEAAIGASEGTVKTHTSRALTALRKALTDKTTESSEGPDVVLSDDQIIDELRRTLAAETDQIDPRPGLLGRVHQELAATPARERQARRPRFRADAIVAALAAGVALAIAAVALVLLHHSNNANPTPANPVAVGTASIAAQAPDPSGGLPWALRTIQTGRLQACLQIGRLQSGQIGALGQDGAFDNDGRFHPIPLANNFRCGRTDAHGYLFLNVFAVQIPASAALGPRAAADPPSLQRDSSRSSRNRCDATRAARREISGMSRSGCWAPRRLASATRSITTV